ncbi:unnamed protein product [Protopolystoma xenopodis]|uniref:UCH37-like C-terminal domain-containing protein n=1 Tax=Protopolystoma xenopodis TaxID=117903 RepID=A0A3S5B693_9PLAT|nr:unnamed protein product [Protopolystoma xenopodis]
MASHSLANTRSNLLSSGPCLNGIPPMGQIGSFSCIKHNQNGLVNNHGPSNRQSLETGEAVSHSGTTIAPSSALLSSARIHTSINFSDCSPNFECVCSCSCNRGWSQGIELVGSGLSGSTGNSGEEESAAISSVNGKRKFPQVRKQQKVQQNHLAPPLLTACFTAGELEQLLSRVSEQIRACHEALREEEEKRRVYRVDDARRVHDYMPFIRTFLLALQRHGMLRRLVAKAQSRIRHPPSHLPIPPPPPPPPRHSPIQPVVLNPSCISSTGNTSYRQLLGSVTASSAIAVSGATRLPALTVAGVSNTKPLSHQNGASVSVSRAASFKGCRVGGGIVLSDSGRTKLTDSTGTSITNNRLRRRPSRLPTPKAQKRHTSSSYSSCSPSSVVSYSHSASATSPIIKCHSSRQSLASSSTSVTAGATQDNGEACVTAAGQSTPVSLLVSTINHSGPEHTVSSSAELRRHSARNSSNGSTEAGKTSSATF